MINILHPFDDYENVTCLEKVQINNWDIFFISILGLFLEMLFIRWISTEIRIFAYLQNTVLVICFLGLGLGCFTCRQPAKLRQMLLPLLILMIIFSVPFVRHQLGMISAGISVLEDFVIWNYTISSDSWHAFLYVGAALLVMYLLMLLILDVFIPIGRILGRLMDDHSNTILAYSVNVGGSLVGIWLFVLLSIFYQPPLSWFIVVGLLATYFIRKTSENWKINLAMIIAIILLSFPVGSDFSNIETIWSPYQKLSLRGSDKKNGEIGKYIVNVNNTGYQVMLDLSQTSGQTHKFSSDRPDGVSQYDLPLLLHPNPEKYLIVGAGAGNDAAGGIRHKIKNITAVEIDAGIISMGSRYHPEKPYASPDVKLINDDARSYFATCKEKYDVITFGLLDSHTTSSMTNTRLDHYVYTKESILHAKSLLKENGIIVLSFEAQKPFIADRMAKILKVTFDQEPLSFRIPFSAYGWGGVMFIAGDLNQTKTMISKNSQLSSLIQKWKMNHPVAYKYTTKITSDDWPYIYLEKPSVPIIYYFLAMLIGILVFRSYKRWNAVGLIGRWNQSHWHFFFLGAGFLLLEVQNISKASVVLGSTWQVNAIIISGVLFMILFANICVYKFPNISNNFIYLILISTCLGLYFIDLSRFAFLPYPTKALTVGILATLPMLFSGIIFIKSFSIVTKKDEALGANLIGALVGAMMQSVTFVSGIKFLLLLVAVFYMISYFTRARAALAQMN